MFRYHGPSTPWGSPCPACWPGTSRRGQEGGSIDEGLIAGPTPGSSSPLARYDRWATGAPRRTEKRPLWFLCRGALFDLRKLNLFFSVAPVAVGFCGFPWLSGAHQSATEGATERARGCFSVAQQGVCRGTVVH